MKRPLLTAVFALACRPDDGHTNEPKPKPDTRSKAVDSDEPAHLAGVFRHTPLQPIQVTEQTIEKTIGRVRLDLKWFEVSGIAASVADLLNREVRAAVGIDTWAKGDPELDGTVTAHCEPGLAFVDLVSFGCDTMNDTRTIEEADGGEGGAPAGTTGVARTFAIAEGKLVPVTLAELLRPGVDLTALTKRVAGEGDAPIENWRDGQCDLGSSPVWQLDVDGLRLWDAMQSCNSLLVPYEQLVEIAKPGGVIARYVAITAAD